MTTKARVIVCDDDPDLRDTLAEYMTRQGYDTDTAADGPSLRRLVPSLRPDLVLLDLNMPGEDGLSLARWLRAEHRCAIVMLTAMDSLPDRVVGLEMGADDYLAKPVELTELRARIRAVLRRTMPPVPASVPAPQQLRLGRCDFDVADRRLLADDGTPVALTAMELDLLCLFVAHARRALTRDQILALAHHRESGPFDRSVDNRITRLRRKIEVDPAHPRILRTIRGEGYMLVPEGD